MEALSLQPVIKVSRPDTFMQKKYSFLINSHFIHSRRNENRSSSHHIDCPFTDRFGLGSIVLCQSCQSQFLFRYQNVLQIHQKHKH